MDIGNRSIDHIVYGVTDLDEAIKELEDKTGCQPVFGGYHTNQGTKNALLNIGNQCYLELLAIDSENLKVTQSRWMGMGLLKSNKISRWSLKSDDLQSDSAILKTYHSAMGHLLNGKRKTSSGELLKWRMTVPLASPEVELVPFMTDWSKSSFHPTDNLENDCQLIGIRFTHPDPSLVCKVFDGLGLDLEVQKGDDPSIQIQLQTPKGEVVIH